MKQNVKFKQHIALAVILTSFIACEREEDKTPMSPNEINNTHGYFVMCEGLYGQNNSTIDFCDIDSLRTIKDFYTNVNGKGLGETANDMIKVGNEAWIVVNGSANITIISAQNGEFKHSIPTVNENNVNRQPRHLVAKNSYVYVSCFDGTVLKINAATKQIEDVLETQGRNPEGLAIAGNKLYVANSGGLAFPNYDNKVSIIDLSSFTVEKLVDVMDNPTIVKSDGDKAYVLSVGNYSVVPRLYVFQGIDKIDSTNRYMTDFDIYAGKLFYFDFNKSDSDGLAYLDLNNLNTSSPTHIALDSINGRTIYHIQVFDNTIFLTDAKNYTVSGAVYALSLTGDVLFSFQTSINPSRVIKKDN